MAQHRYEQKEISENAKQTLFASWHCFMHRMLVFTKLTKIEQTRSQQHSVHTFED